MSDWLSGIISWSGSDYFKFPYASNIYQGRALDPDPGVGPYEYVPSKYDHLWIGHYVYLSPLAPAAAASLNADWELDQGGALIAGIATSQYPAVPPGYTGATVPMPNNAPPPPPPVQPVKVAPPLPLPPPTPRPTPRPTPTPHRRFAPTPAPAGTPMVAPTSPAASRCSAMICALSGLRSGWGAVLGGLVMLGALLLAMVLLVRRRIRRRQQPEPFTTPGPQLVSAEGSELAAIMEDATVATVAEEAAVPVLSGAVSHSASEDAVDRREPPDVLDVPGSPAVSVFGVDADGSLRDTGEGGQKLAAGDQ
jgi:hypothetical protein